MSKQPPDDTRSESEDEATRDDGSQPQVEPAHSRDTAQNQRPKEYGGRKGPDPVRYGDWEKNGRCIDF